RPLRAGRRLTDTSKDPTRPSSGLPTSPVYRPEDDGATPDYTRDLGDPGSYPFTRGIQPTMYRGRLWTMRQYAGFGTAQETNRRRSEERRVGKEWRARRPPEQPTAQAPGQRGIGT